MPSELFWKIKKAKDKFHEKINETLRDRVRYETTQTFKVIQRLKNKGFSPEKIEKEIEKSREMREVEEKKYE